MKCTYRRTNRFQFHSWCRWTAQCSRTCTPGSHDSSHDSPRNTFHRSGTEHCRNVPTADTLRHHLLATQTISYFALVQQPSIVVSLVSACLSTLISSLYRGNDILHTFNICSSEMYTYILSIMCICVFYIVGFIVLYLSLIHIWRCRRIERCRSRWSPYH